MLRYQPVAGKVAVIAADRQTRIQSRKEPCMPAPCPIRVDATSSAAHE